MSALEQLLKLIQLIESLTPRVVGIISALKAEKGMTNEELRAAASAWNDADRAALDRILAAS